VVADQRGERAGDAGDRHATELTYVRCRLTMMRGSHPIWVCSLANVPEKVFA